MLLCVEENIVNQKAILKEQEAEEAKLKEETSLITALMERLQKSRIEVLILPAPFCKLFFALFHFSAAAKQVTVILIGAAGNRAAGT